MTIQLTEKQVQAVEIGLDRYKKGEPYTVISGYAGTGKSTVVKFIVDALNLHPEDIKYVAFTGKAAQVLRTKGHNATTIHKLIYKAFLNTKTGKFVYAKLPPEEVEAKVIIIDEISMVSAPLLRDLASYGIHMIMLGDPGQLPPIGEDNGMLKNPHVFLDEIMRQALDNPIIYLSMLIRTGQQIPAMDNNFVKVVKKSDLQVGMLNWADQVICGRNDTRRMLNNLMRKSKGFEGLPQVGDKMICLRNDWETTNSEGFPIVNGTIGHIEKIHRIGNFNIDEPVTTNKTGIIVNFKPDFSSVFNELNIDPNTPRGFENVLQYQINDPKIRKPEYIYHDMDYGYAITCHKSQGSSWGKVLVIAEVLNSKEYRQWLYTAVTRAEEKLILVMD